LKILVIAAHPDDEILGMGGTLLKHSLKGDKVEVAFMATGITSRRSSKYRNSSKYEIDDHALQKMQKEIKELRKDALKASKILKISKTRFCDFPDNEMDSVPLLKIVKVIENEIKITKPDRIYTNHYSDLNIDHRIVYQATLTACRPIKDTVNELISFEVPSSTEWNYPTNFSPNYFVDIQNQLNYKIKAMKAYKNEIKKFPHPRSTQNLKATAQKWGSVVGMKAAEAFEIIRKLEKK